MKHITKTCEQCSATFHVSPSKQRAKFCSPDCYRANRKQRPRKQSLSTMKCKQCGSEFRAYATRYRVFCSIQCKANHQKEHMKGSKNHNWKPTKYIRPSNKTGLRKHIAARDVVCLDCGAIHHLEVHHIDGNPKNNEDSNLALLCNACHAKRHELMGQPRIVGLILAKRSYHKQPAKPCPVCGKSFVPCRKSKLTCSDECAAIQQRISLKGRSVWNKGINDVELICCICGKSFTRTKGRIKNPDFVCCSKPCQIRHAVNSRIGAYS